jgi:hypothetical protein
MAPEQWSRSLPIRTVGISLARSHDWIVELRLSESSGKSPSTSTEREVRCGCAHDRRWGLSCPQTSRMSVTSWIWSEVWWLFWGFVGSVWWLTPYLCLFLGLFRLSLEVHCLILLGFWFSLGLILCLASACQNYRGCNLPAAEKQKTKIFHI